jgi:hypothetical protein
MSTDGFTFGKPIQNWAESDLNNLGRILNEVLTGTSSYSRDRGIPGASVGKPRKSLENFEMHPTDRLKSLLKKLFKSNVKNQFRSLNEAKNIIKQIIRKSNLNIKSVPIRTPVMDDVSKETHIRYASLEDSASDELDENSYAAKLLSQYHAKDPWFSKAPALCRSIYQDSDKRIFRTLFFQDLHSPSRLIGGALIWALFSCWTFLAFPIWDAVPTSLLLTILLVERYFNVRTLTTPDALTIPGIGLGLFISWIVTGLHADPIGGDLFMHLAMSLGIFTLLFGINRRFKKQYLGMGTVKLLAMIAAFIGNLALGVLALLPFVGFGYVIFYVAGEPRLKWKNDRLIRTAPTKEVDIPASTLVLISTVIVLIISAVSAHLK